MGESYGHLGLRRWPFPVVPQREHCTFIAAREHVRKDVDGLIDTLSRRDTSSIHLFWSWFGAGKTHTLYYIVNRTEALSKGPFIRLLRTAYSEFPKAARSFLDLYRSFVIALGTDPLSEAFLEICTCNEGDHLQRNLFLASPDLYNAFKVMAMGEPADQLTAMRWLRADPLPVSEFRKVGITQKISGSEEGIRILSAIINLLDSSAKCQHRHGCRVLWLLDEFQRIERSGRAVLQEINTGLHSLFNACPINFSLFLSFSGRPERDRLPSWFSDELRDRIGRTKVIVLPPLQTEEALTFIEEVLAHAREPGSKPRTPYFPFSKETCRAIVAEVQRNEELKPRAIMQAFNAVLQEADLKIEAGKMTSITPEFARQVLAEYIVLQEQEEEEG